MDNFLKINPGRFCKGIHAAVLRGSHEDLCASVLGEMYEAISRGVSKTTPGGISEGTIVRIAELLDPGKFSERIASGIGRGFPYKSHEGIAEECMEKVGE